ncbi:addiction module protein [Ilumatobacter sp.]|uniref:addiction module protein n=1 Tax=Ilumatobacter sp. TaxID=1967498 RepID=UPI003C4743BB
MTEIGRTVLAEALDLPASERADIAAELLASLQPPDEITDDELEHVWADEIRRRVERVRSGVSRTVPWDEVRTDAERQFAQR